MKLNEIIELCEQLSAEKNVKFNIHIQINNRLKTTLGRIKCTENGVPYLMEISGNMIKTCSRKTVEETVKHEWAHWYSYILTGECHGHDKVFRNICADIKCEHNASRNNVEYLQEKEEIYKYIVKCKGCGQEFYYHRQGNVVKNPENYRCKCGGMLVLIKG